MRDTGVGIAPEILPRIFDLFTQGERSLDRSQGGLGIGLALVQRLVEMHGGTVAASSVLGQGSEFVVRLPVVSPPQQQPASPSPQSAQSTGQSLRVLVVDDNVDTVTNLALLVNESGHDVRTAYDGSAVLEAALDYRPNVVLLDIGLPGLNGFEVAKQIRQQPALQNAVLVAMTGYGGVSDLQPSFDAGFGHHLVKPGDFGKVLQILATVSELPAAMKTQGEIEAAICDGISRFEQEYRGRGPKEIRAFLLGDFIVIRLQGMLTFAEQQLAKFPSERGRDLLKQVRTQLIETAKPLIQAMVHDITEVKMVSLHHDISTVTGEAFVIVTLAEPPPCRRTKQ